MAGIDYTTAIIKDGIPVENLTVGPYTVDAYKYWLKFQKGDERAISVINEKNIRSLPETTEIRVIPLVSAKDVKKNKRNTIALYEDCFKNYALVSKKTGKLGSLKRILSRNDYLLDIDDIEELYAYVFRIGMSMFFLFPYSPVNGSTTYCYILDDNGSLALIATGYGHNENPALHWIGRGLPKDAEDALKVGLWKEMTSPYMFRELFVNQVFDDVKRSIDGSLSCGGFTKDTITDPDIRRLFAYLKELR